MITADRLSKRFGSATAVDDVSLEVEPGALVGLVGHDGAGKSTTLRMIVGHVTPTAGTATVLGRPFDKLECPLRRVGVLLGDGIHPGRRVRDHLRIQVALAELDPARIDWALSVVGLDDDACRRGRELPAAMRRRLALAGALLADPEVLILDEPGEGLDAAGLRWLRRLLRHLADDGRTVLVSCKEADEIAEVSDRVLVMDRGRILSEAAPRELTDADAEVIVRSPGAEVVAEELREAGITTAAVSADQVRVRDVPVRVVGEIAQASGVPVWEIREEVPSLDEAVSELAREPPSNGASRGDSAPDDDPRDEPAAPHDDEPLTPDDNPRDGEPPHSSGDAEAAVDAELAALPELERAHVVAMLAPAGGLGRTTLSFLVADVLAASAGMSTLALALSCDGERIAAPVVPDRRTTLGLGDLLGDLTGFDEAAQIAPYVSMARSGAHVLAGFAEREELEQLEPEQLAALLDFTGRFYALVVLDVGELDDATMRGVVRRADRILLLGAPGAVDDLDERSPALDAIEAERSDHATLVFNRVDEGRMRTFAHGGGPGSHVLIPDDHELIRALDAGDFELGATGRATRYALKRLGLAVAENLR